MVLQHHFNVGYSWDYILLPCKEANWRGRQGLPRRFQVGQDCLQIHAPFDCCHMNTIHNLIMFFFWYGWTSHIFSSLQPYHILPTLYPCNFQEEPILRGRWILRWSPRERKPRTRRSQRTAACDHYPTHRGQLPYWLLKNNLLFGSLVSSIWQ